MEATGRQNRRTDKDDDDRKHLGETALLYGQSCGDHQRDKN